MLRQPALLLALLACACAPVPQGEDEPATGAAPAEAVTGRSVQSSADIIGEWDVVSFAGYRPRHRLEGTTRAAMADFGPNGVGLRIECNWSGANGRMVHGRFVSASNDGVPQTLMGCGEEREARDARYFAFFRQSPSVEMLSNGRLRLTAGGEELLLERPGQRRLAFLPEKDELQGSWRMSELTFYEPRGGMSGMGLSEVPGRIVFAGNRLGYNRCPRYDLTFRYTPEGILQKSGGAPLPATPSGCAELAEPSFNGQPPELWNILELLHSNPSVEQVERGMVVSNERMALLLTQEPCETLHQSDDHTTTTVQDCASPE